MDSMNITKGELSAVLDKVEKQALQQVEDYIDELLPDDKQFVECVIRDMVAEMWQSLVFNTAGDNEPNEYLNDIAIEEANKAMNKTNRIADWIYAGREVALIVGGVVLIGTIFYLSFSVFWLLK